MASIAVETQGGRGPNGQIVSIKRAADRRRQRSWKIIDEKKEKYRAKNGSLRNTLTDLKGMACVILINHTSEPVRKKRLSPMSKARREANEQSKDHLRARSGFVKPIRNGLRKKQNLI